MASSANLPVLPSVNWLGYSIDMLTATPLHDLTALSTAVIKTQQLVDTHDDTPRPVDIDGVTYNVPKMLAVAQYVKTPQGDFVIYKDGKAAIKDFQADPGHSVRYLAVSGEASTLANIESFFRDGKQYALYSHHKSQYTASFKNVSSFRYEALRKPLADLDSFPADPDQTVVDKWKSFFATYGSHVITEAVYGAMFRLFVWTSNAVDEVNARFEDDVKAEFSGVPSGGQFNPAVKNEPQYNKFLDKLETFVSVQGGDASITKNLQQNPKEYNNYVKWVQSPLKTTDSDFIRFAVKELWMLVGGCADPEIAKRSADIEKAYKYIKAHPPQLKTHATLYLNSDWAEFDLLAPTNAVIQPDGPGPDPELTEWKDVRIFWGQKLSYKPKELTIPFWVINDGSPIDFSTSHGDISTIKDNPGVVKITIAGKDYVNNKVDHRGSNTQNFYKIPLK